MLLLPLLASALHFHAALCHRALSTDLVEKIAHLSSSQVLWGRSQSSCINIYILPPLGHCVCACVQIAKLLIIPFVCLIERFYLGRVFSREVVGAILLVICGVAIV